MQGRYAAILESRLDKQEYNNDELISIKTRLYLPYYNSSSEYERAYGSIEVDGIWYEYVQRRVHQDTLELLCLPNKAKMNLQTLKNEFFKMSVDSHSQQDKNSNIIKITLPDFCQDVQTFALNSLSEDKHNYFAFNTAFVKTDYSSRGEQPPEQA